jgi:hypothetical protein
MAINTAFYNIRQMNSLGGKNMLRKHAKLFFGKAIGKNR